MEFIKYDDLTVEQKISVDSKDIYARCLCAILGNGLDKLVYDKERLVRIAVAQQGYGLDILIDDDDYRVRNAVESYIFFNYDNLEAWIAYNPDKCLLKENKQQVKIANENEKNKNNVYKKGFFAIDDDAFCLEGYSIPDFNFRGYKMPYFEMSVVKQMSKMYDELKFTYNEKNDTFTVIWIDEENDDEAMECTGQDIILNDNTIIHAYSIGAGLWPWERYESSRKHQFSLTKLGNNKHNMEIINKHENFFLTSYLEKHFKYTYNNIDKIYSIYENLFAGKKHDIELLTNRKNLGLERILSNFTDNDIICLEIINLEIINSQVAFIEPIKESLKSLNLLDEYNTFSKSLLRDIYAYALDRFIDIRNMSDIINEISIIQNSRTNEISIFLEHDDYNNEILFSATKDKLEYEFELINEAITNVLNDLVNDRNIEEDLEEIEDEKDLEEDGIEL